jgi:acetyltransferase-like isoleucine patch superfamily enzyme
MTSRRRRRRRLWRLYYEGLLPPPPSAFASWGEGTIVMPPARVESPGCIELGRDVRLHEYSWLCVQPQPGQPPPRLRIGDGVRIGRFCKIVCTGEVVIERDTLIGDHVSIADTRHTFDDPSRPIAQQPLAPARPVHIGPGSFVGVRAMVQPGVTIGQNGYVGAAAVVGEDVPGRSVVIGDPARVIRRYDPGSGTWHHADGDGPGAPPA